jgi:hypothetical protein
MAQYPGSSCAPERRPIATVACIGDGIVPCPRIGTEVAMATARADWQQNSLRHERPPASRPERRTPPPPLPPLPELAGRRPPAPAESLRAADRARSLDRDDRLRDDRLRDDGMRDDRRRGDRMRPERGADRLRGERDVRAQRGLRGGRAGYADPAREDVDAGRPPAPRRAPDVSRPVGRQPGSARGTGRRPAAPPVERTEAPGSRLRGIVAVLGVFLLTLAGGAVDWFTGDGLGLITLVALVTATAIATLVVRRRDMATVVLSPPLVFTAVTGMTIAISPSLVLSIPTVATLLIRGFPTMAWATAGALVLMVVRLVSRR